MYRGNGYGSMLLGKFIDYAKEHYANKIVGTFSDVDNNNSECREKMYRKFGFDTFEVGKERHILLKLSL
ncbi:hypothetical protein FACS1894188_10880 [Clostridia bacterium]|nr:hypothetical protein FACS1894188_10880 [Clostridia bacterium]